ncbi:unnamed protein product [Effrenium voratum]|nr:unnamed protein product [Effrenium voratum]
MPECSVESNNICLNAALSACQRAGLWQRALSLLRGPPDSAGLHVLLCCAEGSGWPLALALLAAYPTESPAALDAACMACCRALRWREAVWLARALLQSPSPGRVEALAALAALFEEEGLEQPRRRLLQRLGRLQGPEGLQEVLMTAADLDPQAPPLPSSVVGLQGSLARLPAGPATGRLPYQKEVALLRHVLRSCSAGDGAAVEEAMDSFAGRLGAAGGWAKFAGGTKAEVLLRAAAGAQGGAVLDVGAYCGGSALRLARRAAGEVVALELDVVLSAIARVLLTFAGVRVRLLTGHTRQLLPRLRQPGGFAAVFLDVWGSQYAEVLASLRPCLAPGALLCADNVLRTAAAEFLWRVAGAGAAPGFRTLLLPVTEVVKQSEEDWMSVTVVAGGDLNVFEVPAPLLQLQAASEFLRARATNVGAEPEEFDDLAQHAKHVLRSVGIVPVDGVSWGKRVAADVEGHSAHDTEVRLGGAFHVGVEVGGMEWSYGRTFRDSRPGGQEPGVVGLPPRKDPNHSYREPGARTLQLGVTDMSLEDVNEVISNMIEAGLGEPP